MTNSTVYVIRTTNHDLSRYEEQLPHHLTWVKEHVASGTFLFSGPQENRFDGGVIIARAASREALDLILQSDPFRTSGVSTHDVVAFNALFGSLAHTLTANA